MKALNASKRATQAGQAVASGASAAPLASLSMTEQMYQEASRFAKANPQLGLGEDFALEQSTRGLVRAAGVVQVAPLEMVIGRIPGARGKFGLSKMLHESLAAGATEFSVETLGNTMLNVAVRDFDADRELFGDAFQQGGYAALAAVLLRMTISPPVTRQDMEAGESREWVRIQKELEERLGSVNDLMARLAAGENPDSLIAELNSAAGNEGMGDWSSDVLVEQIDAIGAAALFDMREAGISVTADGAPVERPYGIQPENADHYGIQAEARRDLNAEIDLTSPPAGGTTSSADAQPGAVDTRLDDAINQRVGQMLGQPDTGLPESPAPQALPEAESADMGQRASLDVRLPGEPVSQTSAPPEPAVAPSLTDSVSDLPMVQVKGGGTRAFPDARLRRGEFRSALQVMADSLKKGGGSMGRVDTYDGTRPREGNEWIGIPSENPSWFQSIAQEEGVTVANVQKAVQKALEGQRLGERQARVIEAMLHTISAERIGADSDRGFGPDSWRDVLARYRDQRRAERGEITDAEIDSRVDAAVDRELDMAEQRFIADDYAAEMVQADRVLYDLAQDAAAVDEMAVNRILESNRDETETIRALWEITQRGQDGQGEQGVPGEQGQGASQPEAQQGQEAGAEPALRPALAEEAGQEVTQTDPLSPPTEAEQALSDRARQVDERLQGRGSPDMLEGDGELFAGPRPDQGGLFGDLGTEGASADTSQPDRRQDMEGRATVDQMTPEEMRQALLTDELTGLGNRRAFNEALVDHDGPVVSIDADSLKWINDNMSPETGDELLQAIGRAIQNNTSDGQGFHISGDEFYILPEANTDITAVMDAINAELAGAVLSRERPDGTVVTKTGVEITHGQGQSRSAADDALKQEKQARESRGERAARGEEPPGVSRQPARVSGEPATGRQTDRDAPERPPPITETQPTPETPPDGGVSRSGEGVSVEGYGDESLDLRRRQDRQQSLERELSDDDLANMPLSKIWPKKEVDAIEDIPTAAFMTAIRSYIPNKPRKAYAKRQWVEMVKTVRELGQMYQDGRADEIVELMNSGRSVRDPLAHVANQAELLQSIPRDQWSRIGPVAAYPGAQARRDGEWVSRPVVYVKIDKRSRGFPGETVADVVEKVMAVLQDQSARRAKIKFDIRQRRTDGSVFINKKGDAEYRPLREFETVDQARAFLRDHPDQLEQAWEQVKERDNVRKTDVRRAENRARQGKAHRGDRDVTSEEFVNTFGLRHVDFGEWVGQGRDAQQRQRLVNEAYDALMDLSDIVGVPSEAIGLDGRLIVTFGKRGSGWASAHFEPGMFLINLTKTRGAGSLAHEWFHALDNYFQRQRGETGSTRETNFITYAPENYYVHQPTGQRVPARDFEAMAEGRSGRRGQRFAPSRFNRDDWTLVEGVRPEVADAFANLVETLDDSPMTGRARLIDKGKSDGYWSRIIERAARSFENYVIDAMAKEGYQNDFLANVQDIESFQRDKGRYPYLKPDEVRPVAEAFGNLFETLETRETDQGVELYSRGEGGQGTTTQAVLESLSPRARRALVDSGLVTVTDTPSQWPGNHPADAAGAWIDGKIYLATNNIRPGRERGLILHEVGVHHGLKDMLGERYDALIGQLKRQVERGGRPGAARAQREAHAAHQRALADDTIQGNQDAIWEETIAYMAEAGADTALFRQIVAAVRDFLRRLGLVRGFTNADVAHLARGSVARVVDGIEASQGTSYAPAMDAPLFSRDSDWGGRVVPPGNTLESAIEALRERQGGYVEDALVHPDIGPIDLVWGREGTASNDFSDGFGLAKIIRKHPEVDPKQIQELLHEARMTPSRHSGDNRAVLASDSHTFVVKKEWRGERARWLLTAYGKEEASPGRSVGVAGRTDPGHPPGQEASSTVPQGRIIGVAEGTASERPSGQGAADTQTVPSPGESSQSVTDAEVRAFMEGFGEGAPTEAQVREAIQQFRDTEQTLGGREAYEQARSEGRTNLNYGQWVAVRTPNFKRWFGDWESSPDSASKVVDSDTGEPLVVYHGTKGDFAEFQLGRADRRDGGWFGDGFYLTASQDLASSYAMRERDHSLTDRPANVMPVYVRMSNPYRINLAELSYDEGSNFTKKYGGNEGFRKWLADNGYDGVIGYRDPEIAGQGAEFWEVVVFDPTQIKSATGNSGAFDSSSPDIRYSRSEQTRSDYEQRIDEIFRGGKPSARGVRMLDRSDILSMMGISEGPVHVVEGKVRDSRHNHRMSAADWKKVPEWLDDPAAVFDSETTPGRLVVFAPATVKGNPVRIIVDPRAEGGVNLTVNAYDAGRNPIRRWIDAGLLRYVNEKKTTPAARSFQPRLTGLPGKQGSAPSLEPDSGLQLPRVGEIQRGYGHKIYTQRDLVKHRKQAEGGKTSYSRREDSGFVADPSDPNKPARPGKEIFSTTVFIGRDSNGRAVTVQSEHPSLREQGKLRKHARKLFTKEGLFNPETFARHIETQGLKNADEVDVQFMTAELIRQVTRAYRRYGLIPSTVGYELIPAAEKEKMNNYLAGENVEGLPREVRNALNTAAGFHKGVGVGASCGYVTMQACHDKPPPAWLCHAGCE